MSVLHRKRPSLKLKLRLRQGPETSPSNGAGAFPAAVGGRLLIGVLSQRARTRARTKRVIQASAVRADNYQRVTTAKASVEKIDVRQVERGGSRRTLRVAMLPFALAASIVAALAVAGAAVLTSDRSDSRSAPTTPG